MTTPPDEEAVLRQYYTLLSQLREELDAWAKEREEIEAYGGRSGFCLMEETGDALAALGAPILAPLALLMQDPLAGNTAAYALGKIGTAAIPTLIQAFKIPGVTYIAWYGLGLIRPAPVEALLPLLDDPEEEVRRSTVYLLTTWGLASVPLAKEPLLQRLETADWCSRLHIVRWLGNLQDPSMIPTIGRRLKDPSVPVREEAVYALQYLGDARALDLLFEALQDPSWLVRGKAAYALGALQDARAIPPLLAALKDRNDQSQFSAICALQRFGPVIVPHLIQSLQDRSIQIRQGAAIGLGYMADARAIAPLRQTLKDPHSGVRSRAIEALAKLGGAEAAEALQDALSDPEAWVRQKAAEALATIQAAASGIKAT